MATFLLANYIAHAATLKLLPGESTLSVLRNSMCSLLFPVSGVRRGVTAIYQRAIFAKTPLEAAARANALCMVVRSSEWKPEHGDVVELVGVEEVPAKPWWREDCSSGSRAKRLVAGVSLGLAEVAKLCHRCVFMVTTRTILQVGVVSDVPAYMVKPRLRLLTGQLLRELTFQPSSSSWNSRDRTVHGVCQLPSGYALCTVPPGSHVVELDESQQGGEDQPGKNQLGAKDTRENTDKSENEDQEGGKVMAGSRCSLFKTQVSCKRTLRQFSLNNLHSSTIQLSSVNNFAKGLVAIFQTLYASFTLYQARGDQIQHYGYAAFGLTVVPYIVMSIINLASTVLTPDYSVMYLVESEAMEQAKKREHAKFEGVVGRILKTSTSNESSQTVKFEFNGDGKMVVLAPGSDDHFTKFDKEAEMDVAKQGINPWTGHASPMSSLRPRRMISRSSELPQSEPRFRTQITLWTCSVLALVSLAVNGALSNFKSRQSTLAQRVWTMAWLAFGMVSDNVGNVSVLEWLLISPPAIGGFVVVSQMIMQYGNCVKLD